MSPPETNVVGINVKVSFTTVVIFSIIFSPLLIGGLLTDYSSTRQIIEGLLLCAAYPVLVYWICSPTVCMADKIFTYRTLFSRHSINLESITKVAVVARPAPGLELYTSSNSKAFRFVIKPFSKAGVSFIIHHIKSFSPHARFDSISLDLEQGDFRSVTRETLGTRNLIRIVATAGFTIFILALARALFH